MIGHAAKQLAVYGIHVEAGFRRHSLRLTDQPLVSSICDDIRPRHLGLDVPSLFPEPLAEDSDDLALTTSIQATDSGRQRLTDPAVGDRPSEDLGLRVEAESRRDR